MKKYINPLTNEQWHFEDYVEDVFALPNTPKTLIPYIETEQDLLAIAKAKKLNEIEEAYQAELVQNIEYLGHTYQADLYSQELMKSVVSAGSLPEGFYWRDIVNNSIPMTFVQLQGLIFALVQRGQIAFTKRLMRKEAVATALTVKEVLLIV